MLQMEGWQVNHKRVERIWRQEGLKVPKKQPKRGRLWLNDGSCLRLRPEYPDHVWSYDFVLERTHDGRAFRILNVIDEYTRECLAIRVERNLDHEDVQECLAELFCTRGVPTHLRSDNGPEFIAIQLRLWLNRLGVKTLFIEPGSPWENGYVESFNGKMREELLDREIFFTLEEAKTLIALERGVQSLQTTQCFRLSSPCTTGLVACSTASYCSRSNIATGTIIGGWSGKKSTPS